MLLSKQQVLESLCELCSYVRDQQAAEGGYFGASDCFCGHNKFAPQDSDYRMESHIIEFIIQATKDKINREKQK